MTYAVTEALNATKALMAGLAPDDVDPLTGVYVYPDDYGGIDGDALSLPLMVISEAVGRVNQHGDYTSGRGMGSVGFHRWPMEIIVLLSEGEHSYPTLESAAAELKQANWRRAILDVLSQNRTLSDTVFDLGQQRSQGSVSELILMESMIAFGEWNQQPYWMIRGEVPVLQVYDRS